MDKKKFSRFRGIGIRIEDEVLITETGYEVYSFDLVCIWLYEFRAARWPFQFSWFFPFIWCYYHQIFPFVVWFNAFNLMQLELLIRTITFIVVVNITSTVTAPFWNSFETSSMQVILCPPKHQCVKLKITNWWWFFFSFS